MQTGQSEHSIYLTVSIEKKNVSATTEGESSICCWDFFYNYPNGYIYWIFSRNLINWDTMESVYFGQTGNVVKSHFLSVAVVIWLMYVLKLILLFVMVDIFLWYPKTLFFIWIVLLVPIGIEALHYGKIYFSLFAVWQTSWNTPGKWLGIILIGIVVFFIEKLIGEKMIERRDIWR